MGPGSVITDEVSSGRLATGGPADEQHRAGEADKGVGPNAAGAFRASPNQQPPFEPSRSARDFTMPVRSAVGERWCVRRSRRSGQLWTRRRLTQRACIYFSWAVPLSNRELSARGGPISDRKKFRIQPHVEYLPLWQRLRQAIDLQHKLMANY